MEALDCSGLLGTEGYLALGADCRRLACALRVCVLHGVVVRRRVVMDVLYIVY